MSPDLLAALDLPMDSDIGTMTIRAYLHQLLLTLWTEEEGFSGKRPFGNSNWQSEIYTPLVRAGYVRGTFASYGPGNVECLDTLDEAAAQELVAQLIHVAFFGEETTP